jgi:NDP-sugar pyrophosphorylase family protein
MQVVVLAGGRGTRLGHLARDVPKFLQPVGDRVFCDLMLDVLVRRGLTRFLLCLDQHASLIVAHLSKDWARRVDIQYHRTSAAGTGGAVSAALRHLDERFLLVMGDTFIDADIAATISYLNPPFSAAMLVRPGRNGNVNMLRGVVSSYDKGAQDGHWLDTGVAAVSRVALEQCTREEECVDLGDFWKKLIRRRSLAGVVTGAPFYDIGTSDRLALFRLAICGGGKVQNS